MYLKSYMVHGNISIEDIVINSVYIFNEQLTMFIYGNE